MVVTTIYTNMLYIDLHADILPTYNVQRPQQMRTLLAVASSKVVRQTGLALLKVILQCIDFS